ncbi:MAG: alpha/beta fold hydrolase [Gammaproteobacteria bacterium]
MPVVRRQFVDGPYGQMHLRLAAPDRSTNAPLVCLHMFPQSGRSFSPFLSHIATDRTAVALDFPGYGESAPPPAPISASDYAKAMWAAVDALELTSEHDRIDLLGVHAGAKLAVEMIRQRPDGVRRPVLFSAAVFTPQELATLRESFSSMPLDEAGARFQFLWSLLVKYRGPELELEDLAITLAEMLRGGEGYEWGHDAVFEYNRIFPDVLRSLSHHVVLVNPNDDLYTVTPRTADYLAQVDLHDRPSWHHGFFELHAEEVATQVRGWLSN